MRRKTNRFMLIERNKATATMIYQEDSKYISLCKSVDWKSLDNSTVLVTGATGLLGSNLIRGLLYRNKIKGSQIVILALVRELERFEKVFSDVINRSDLVPIVGNVIDFDISDLDVDYIIHGASVTASVSFIKEPVETIITAIEGTKHILDIAVQKKVKSFVYLSSMEVYGKPENGAILTENLMGYLDPMSVRSSYSESKKMCETLCVSYSSEYRVPVRIVRLTQTFGPGVATGDKRVFADFASHIISNEDIVLMTKGESARMYLYTADAATAILTVLTKGSDGQAYNAANMTTYCTISEMADMLVNELGNGKLKVVFDLDDDSNRGFNPVQQVYLDTSKISALGWECRYGLIDMYKRMICCM